MRGVVGALVVERSLACLFWQRDIYNIGLSKVYLIGCMGIPMVALLVKRSL
jgi:hypothetical protein